MKTWLCTILVLLSPACGLEQDISFDEAGTAPPEGPYVSVVWADNEMPVFLDPLDKIVVQERLVCLLWDVLLAAGLEEEELLAMRFDFESKNGFRPSQNGCDSLDGETLALGYLDSESLALLWDDTLGLRGCYWVTQTERILGEAVQKRPSAVLSLFRFDFFGLRLPLPLQSHPAQISFGIGDSTRGPTPPDITVLRHASLVRSSR
jgi:hypothetical protein